MSTPLALPHHCWARSPPPVTAPHHGSGSTQHWHSVLQVPFSLPKLTATMPGPGTLQSALKVGVDSKRHSQGAVPPWGKGDRVMGPWWAPSVGHKDSSEHPRGCQGKLCHHPALGMEMHGWMSTGTHCGPPLTSA